MCFPFKYAYFFNTRNIIKYLFLTCCVSCLAAINHLAVVISRSALIPPKQIENHESLLQCLRFLTPFKLILVKTLQLVANLKLDVAIRKSLNESVDFFGRQIKSPARLFSFSLLPSCFNVFFSIHESLAIVFSFTAYNDSEAFV